MLTNKNTPGSRFFRHFFACGAFYKGKSPYQCSIYLKIFACGAFCKCKFPYCDSIYLLFFACGAFYKGKSPYYHSIYIFSPAALLVPLLSLNTPIFSHCRRNILGISSDNNVVYPCKMRRANPLIVYFFSPAAPLKQAIPYCIVSNIAKFSPAAL